MESIKSKSICLYSMIITHREARQLLAAKLGRLKELEISLDLGLSRAAVRIESNFIFPDGQALTEKDMEKVVKKDTSCFLISDNGIHKLELFSEETNNYYKLVPTGSWPTLEISGIRMHVTKSMSPEQDTLQKISFIEPCLGNVLDTCTGLGYTAIVASRTADSVDTFEIDENVIELQKHNPHSSALFAGGKIRRHHGDIFEEIKKIAPGSFDRIVHDPPRLSLSTVLYSQGFYDQLFRVMRKGGKIYHYTGNPGAKNRNMDLPKGVIRRMGISGFSNLKEVFNGVYGERN